MDETEETQRYPGLYERLNHGLVLYHRGEYFEAHEVWEEAWLEEVGRRKLLLQLLVQVAAAAHKHRTGVAAGTCKLLAKAADKASEVRAGASSCLGFDVVALEQEIRRALQEADQVARQERQDLQVPALPLSVGQTGILYLHGFASGPTSFKARALIPMLRAEGLHVELPDLNQDDFTGLTISRAVAQAKRHLRDRTLIIGSSLGGYIGSLLASQDERVVGLILLAPAFAIAQSLEERYGQVGLSKWEVAGKAPVEHHAYGDFRMIAFKFYEDAKRHPPFPKVRSPVPVHILHGDQDTVVPMAVVKRFLEQTPQAVLEVLEDDHGLTKSTDRIAEVVNKFVLELGFKTGTQG